MRVRLLQKWLAVMAIGLVALTGWAGRPALADTGSGLVLTAAGPTEVIVDQENEFTVTLESDADYNDIVVNFRIAGETTDPFAVSIQYWEGTPEDGQWLNLPLAADPATGVMTGTFGPSTGFPVDADYLATSPFKVTFGTVGKFTTTITAVSLSAPNVALAETSLAVTVRTLTPADLVLSVDGPDAVLQDVESMFNVRLQNTGETGMEDVLVTFAIAGTSDPADIAIFYPVGEEWVELPLAVSGDKLVSAFGPPQGFPVVAGYDEDTAFKVTFHKTGVYEASFAAIAVGVEAEPQATAEWNVTVLPGLSLIAEGPKKTVVEHETPLAVTLINPSDTAVDDALVLFEVVFAVEGATEVPDLSIRYKEGSEWVELPFAEMGGNLVGHFGPATGFPVEPGYEVESIFKVTYHAAGTYTATFRAISVANPEVTLAMAAKTIEVAQVRGQGKWNEDGWAPGDKAKRADAPDDPLEPDETPADPREDRAGEPGAPPEGVPGEDEGTEPEPPEEPADPRPEKPDKPKNK